MNRFKLSIVLLLLSTVAIALANEANEEALKDADSDSTHTGAEPQKRSLKKLKKLKKLALLKKKGPWFLPQFEVEEVKETSPLPVFKVHKYAGIEVKPIPTTPPPPPPPAVYGPPSPPPTVYGPPETAAAAVATSEGKGNPDLAILDSLGPLVSGEGGVDLSALLSIAGSGEIPLEAIETLSQIAKTNPKLVASIVSGLKNPKVKKAGIIAALLKLKAKKKLLKKKKLKLLAKGVAAKAAITKKKLLAPFALVAAEGAKVASAVSSIPSNIAGYIWPEEETGPYEAELPTPLEEVSPLFSLEALLPLPGLPLLKFPGKYKLKKHHPYVSVKLPTTHQPAPPPPPPTPAPVYGPPPPAEPVPVYGPPPPPAPPVDVYGPPQAPAATYGVPSALAPGTHLEPPPLPLDTPRQVAAAAAVDSYQVPIAVYAQGQRLITPAGTTLTAPAYYNVDSFLAASENDEVEAEGDEGHEDVEEVEHVVARGNHSEHAEHGKQTAHALPSHNVHHVQAEREHPAYHAEHAQRAEHGHEAVHAEHEHVQNARPVTNQMRRSPPPAEQKHEQQPEQFVRGEVFVVPLNHAMEDTHQQEHASEESNSASH